MSANRELILEVVRRIPEGCVATYGQVAALAGIPRNARQVGTVLGQLDEDDNVPWHRVVNAAGRISDRGKSAFEGLQRFELENEGVEFLDSDRIELQRFQWDAK